MGSGISTIKLPPLTLARSDVSDRKSKNNPVAMSRTPMAIRNISMSSPLQKGASA
jgi:hypothetical protein